MKIFQTYNCYDAALERIRWLFDEFENVVVGISGGKDSTVVLELTKIVAAERNRLPVKVMFLDQEAEWKTVVEHVREINEDPDVDLSWYQMPIKLFNATSHDSEWSYCWDPENEAGWMRPKEPGAITDNVYGTDRFAECFPNILKHHFPDSPACYIAGVRCEESPTRMVGLTAMKTYKHITYGKALDKKIHHYTFYPVYDWSFRDVWYAIESKGWPYCKIYDYMYQRGLQINDMRVSNLHHETAIKNLIFMQEIEPDTWVKLTERVEGANTIKHMNKESAKVPKELPEAFETWTEYRDYLVEHLLQSDDAKDRFRKIFAKMDTKYDGMHHLRHMYRVHIRALLLNDWHMTTIINWERDPLVHSWRQWKKNGTKPILQNLYING